MAATGNCFTADCRLPTADCCLIIKFLASLVRASTILHIDLSMSTVAYRPLSPTTRFDWRHPTPPDVSGVLSASRSWAWHCPAWALLLLLLLPLCHPLSFCQLINVIFTLILLKYLTAPSDRGRDLLGLPRFVACHAKMSPSPSLPLSLPLSLYVFVSYLFLINFARLTKVKIYRKKKQKQKHSYTYKYIAKQLSCIIWIVINIRTIADNYKFIFQMAYADLIFSFNIDLMASVRASGDPSVASINVNQCTL